MLDGVLNTPLYDLCTFLLTVHNSFIAWKGGAQGLSLLIKTPEQASKLILCLNSKTTELKIILN